MSRVLLLLTAPAWRGSGLSFAKIALALRDGGHDVTTVVATESVERGLQDCGVHQVVPLDLVDSGRASVGLLRQLRGRSPWNLVIADSPRDVRLASSAGLGPIAWRFNLPNRRVPSDPWSRWLFRRVRRMIYQSRFAETLVAERAPWLAARGGDVILNGYDVERLVPDPARGMAWRTVHGIAPDAPLLVTVGALSPEKALPATLAVGAALAAEFPGLRQALVGTGEDLDRLVREAGAHACLVGELEADATQDAMRAADVMLQLSPRETFSNVVAEAMAMGAAVVGASTGGIAEVIGEAGVRVASDDIAGITGAVRGLLDDPARRTAQGIAARERIVTTYPLERMAAGYRDLVAREAAR